MRPCWTILPRGPDMTQHKPLILNDTTNAARLVDSHGHRLRFVPRWGLWLVCSDDGFWAHDLRDVRVRELAKDVGKSLQRAAANMRPDEAQHTFKFGLRSQNAREITSMVNLARGVEGIPLEHEALDADPWLLGTSDGVLDLRTFEHRPAKPEDLISRRCTVPYDPNATAPRWERALEEWFPDVDVRAYVQRLAGSVLVGAQRDHLFVIHYGPGGNGKGTFMRALQNVLGPYAVEVHLSLLIESKYKEHDTVKADLFRTRLAMAVETDKRVRLAEASVKNLTGGDRIRARRMREDPWSFDPTHSLWLQTNHLPEIGGRDAGIWRRIRVVKWDSSFSGKMRDPDLDAALAAEGTGILRWMVAGAQRWVEIGLDEPEAIIRETLAYRRAEDVLDRFRVSVGLMFEPCRRIRAEELRYLLTSWARTDGIKPPSGEELCDWLVEQGAYQVRDRWVDSNGVTKQSRFWIGVGREEGEHDVSQNAVT